MHPYVLYLLGRGHGYLCVVLVSPLFIYSRRLHFFAPIVPTSDTVAALWVEGILQILFMRSQVEIIPPMLRAKP